MAHPDYPHPTPADQQPQLWLSAAGNAVQVGLSQNKKWMVRVSKPVPTLIHVRATNKPDNPPVHPDTPGADSPGVRALSAMAPQISFASSAVPDNKLWKQFANNPQLGRLIATAIYRMQPLPWPS
jgi:hypothetical protein